MYQQEITVSQFGTQAAKYLTSTVHATGADLDRLEALSAQRSPDRVLDLGCGAGHVSFALARGGARRVVGYDPSPEMLKVVAETAAARGYQEVIETSIGAAEILPFESHTFDLIVTRYSAHHWASVPKALSECARVLIPGGRLIVIDVIAPENPLLDTSLQVIEFLRDASHVRDYRVSEWITMFQAAGLQDPAVTAWKLTIDYKSWLARIGTPPDRIAALDSVFSQWPREARDYFELSPEKSFVTDSLWLEAATTD